MGLLSNLTLAVALLLAAASVGACLALWNRLGSRAWLRCSGRVAMVVVAQLVAVLCAGLVLNKHYDFYTSWSELFGSPQVRTSDEHLALPSLDRAARARLVAAYRAGHSTVLPLTIPGDVSGIPPRPALIYLPAQYGNPHTQNAQYPVVELLDGLPGTPQTWTGALHLQHTLDTAIAALHSVPFIAIMPTTNVFGSRDLECLNVVGGPQVETYLTVDVPAAVENAVRAQRGASGWATMGISTGGYCAMNLAMRHTGQYSAAVSLSGYAHPAVNRMTGPLLGGSTELFNANSPEWEASHWPGGTMNILAVASRHDGPSYRSTQTLAGWHHDGLDISAVLLDRGGHNAHLWNILEPAAFSWLSQHLTAPLAPVAVTVAKS